jgi:quinol monooxygenase YgiN
MPVDVILRAHAQPDGATRGASKQESRRRRPEMPRVTIVANIHANPDKIDLVRAELERLIPITRAEEGCIQYDLHQDNENPVHFLFYENWESRDLWQTHMNAPHLADYMKATEGAVAEFTLHEMSRIG